VRVRIGIIADIHSNVQALEVVMNEMAGAGIDMVVCAGDIVGYGANPNECCRIVRESSAHAVMGNHDLSALTRDTTWMNPYAAEASRWTSSALSNDSYEFLRSLKIEAKFESAGVKVAMYHGSIGSVTEYVYEDDATEGMVARSAGEVLILGHTHVPYVKEFDTRLAVNPGSVGQPRDGDPRASFAVLETDNRRCHIRRVEYDIERTSKAILSAGLPNVLAERLFLGR